MSRSVTPALPPVDLTEQMMARAVELFESQGERKSEIEVRKALAIEFGVPVIDLVCLVEAAGVRYSNRRKQCQAELA